MLFLIDNYFIRMNVRIINDVIELHVTACSELVCYTRTPANKKLMGI